MNLINIVSKKIWVSFARVGMKSASISVNSACMIWFHQPKVPQGLDKMKKIE